MARLAEELAMYVDLHWAPDEYEKITDTIKVLIEFEEHQKARQRPLPHYVAVILQTWRNQHY